MSDEWAAYRTIPRDLGYEHHTVNHSQHFVHPENRQVHIQTMESWNRLRVHLGEHGRNRSRASYEPLIAEFLVRRNFVHGVRDALDTNFKIIMEAADEWLAPDH